jgi:hypothetical protein
MGANQTVEEATVLAQRIIRALYQQHGAQLDLTDPSVNTPARWRAAARVIAPGAPDVRGSVLGTGEGLTAVEALERLVSDLTKNGYALELPRYLEEWHR